MEEIDKKTVWHECLESIKVVVSPATFSTWFTQTHISSFKKTEDRFAIEIGCSSFYVKSTIESRYFGLVQDSLTKALDSLIDLVFIVKENPEGKPQDKTFDSPLFVSSQNNEPEIGNLIERSRLRKNFTFESFAVSSSNQMAWAAAEAVSKTPGSAYNPLFIWGGVGVGKTHLMSAVGYELIKKDPESNIYLCTGEEFTNDIVEGIRRKTTQEFRNKYRKLNLLMVDDIQFIAGKDAVQEEFFHTFNSIVNAGGQVILTSDRPPSEISKLEERLRSRFEAGLIVDIAPPDFELRCAITQIKARQKNLSIPMDAVQAIAGNIDSARKIEGFLIRLSTLSSISKNKPINVETVESVLGKGIETNGNTKKINPNEAIEAVCKRFEIGKRALLGPSRIQKLALPRQILMYFLRMEMKLQLEEVGRIIGGRDHTTVMHAVEKITRLASTSMEVREDIQGIKELCWG